MTINPVTIVKSVRNNKLRIQHEKKVLKTIMFKIEKNLK